MSAEAVQEFTNLRNDESIQIVLNGKKFWVVEGDLLVSEAELFAYARRRVTRPQESIEERSRLVVEVDEEQRIKRWSPGFIISFAVLRDTFPSANKYQIVVDSILRAVNDWESICGVKFDYLPELDDGQFAAAERPTFTVQWLTQIKKFLALSFFPDWAVEDRNLLIFDKFFTDGFYEPEGIMRHELGHVLGFRHEHIRSGAPADCPNEKTANTFNFGEYDPGSVMHYFCGGVGTQEMSFSEDDRIWAKTIYGPPHHTMHYYE
ncbi:MAG: hypothetical protein R3293_28480 [Candidatus Promineifilaceae bacterium]|nr:hypothetical protein [Candidatus Promineifilaceae bacterium]